MTHTQIHAKSTMVVLALLAGSVTAAAEAPRSSLGSASPVDVMDREQIDAQGLADVSQLIGTMPTVAFRNASGNPLYGQNATPGAVDIRGVQVGAFAQTRYSFSQRDDSLLGDDESTIGFQIPRVEIAAVAPVSDTMAGVISFVLSDQTSGEAELEEAFLNYRFENDLTLQIGQFAPGIRRADGLHESVVGGLSHTLTDEFFGTGNQQGIQLFSGFDESSQWAWSTFLSDGPDSQNSDFTSPSEFDYAFGGRFQYKPFGSWGQFADATAFRGTEQGLLAGLGGYIAMDGDTNPSSVSDFMICSLGADLSYEGDGHRLSATFDWLQEDRDGMPTYNDLGWGIEGGVFVTEQLELFGRAEQICVDEDRGLTNDEFAFITFGANFFPILESHALRVSGDVTVALDPTTDKIGLGAPGPSAIGSGSNYGFQGSFNDNEVLFRLQLQGSF